MRDFAEGGKCRPRQICLHFGEIPKWRRCGACDICGAELDWLEPSTAGLKPSKAAMRKAPPGPSQAPVDPELRAALKKWRLQVAKAQTVPAYVILHDAAIEELCRRQPRSMADLIGVPGIGEKKAQRFGSELLVLIAENG
jgi:ATP-dependent DNA helicase RecQ